MNKINNKKTEEEKEMLKKRMVLGVVFVLALFSGLANYSWAEEKGLVGHWKFDEGKGMVAEDSSQNDNKGNIHGATWVKGKDGSALEFDGSKAYVDCGHVIDNGEVTVEMWFKSSYSGFQSLFDFEGTRNNRGSFRFNPAGNGKPYLFLNTHNYRSWHDVSSYMDGNWHFLSLYLPGGGQADIENATLRIDDNFIGISNTHATDPQRAWTDFHIGKGYTTNNFHGAIDEVAIYNRALAKKIPTSQDVFLMIDRTLIQENKGVSLTVCEAVKYPDNPVIRAGKPDSVDERACYVGSMYYVDGKFRMWYLAYPTRKIAYAESDDGIHWVKPNLGLASFRGNKNNNIVPMPGLPTFFYDPDEPNPDQRYKKMVGKGDPNTGNRQSLWTFAYSPDGLRWNTEKRPLPKVYRWAEWQRLSRVGKTWVIHTQSLKSGIGRIANVFYSDDLNKDLSEWKEKIAWSIPEGFHKHYQAHIGLSCWSRPGLTIGLYGIFHGTHELRDTTVDLGFVLSHDGFNFWEPCSLATLIRRGPAGSWDSTFLQQGSMINVDDKTYIYYSGGATGNMGGGIQIGLATLRRDGFGYLGIDVGWNYWKKTNKKGGFVTVPIRLHDKTVEKVLLNVDNLNNSQWVKVELLDEKGQPMPGYTLKEADKVATNGIAVPATWKGNSSLKNVPGDIIRLRIHMQGGQHRKHSPQLYAIYFYQPKDIEQ